MFNNPLYYNSFPYQSFTGNIIKNNGLISKIPKINWSNILNNTQKTLNVINQAIPVYYQIKPIYKNAKTMFRMVNALKENENDNSLPNQEKNTNQEGPIFFT